MRVIAILGTAALMCAGCALETGEQPIGEVAEELGTYSAKFAISDSKQIGPSKFHVAQSGSFNGEVSSTWTSMPGYTCKGKLGILLLKRITQPVETLRGKTFHTGSPKQPVAWTGLPAGDYTLTLDAMNDNPNCILEGDVTWTVVP